MLDDLKWNKSGIQKGVDVHWSVYCFLFSSFSIKLLKTFCYANKKLIITESELNIFDIIKSKERIHDYVFSPQEFTK